MRIKVLGSKGEIEETCRYHRLQSGLLIDNELLLDIGEKKYLEFSPKWIVITHFHPDHAYFVRKGKEEIPKTEAFIYGPESYSALPDLKVKILDRPVKLGKFEIIPLPTHHSKRLKSQAYIVKKGKTSFLYTGDLVWIDKVFHPLFHGVDLIITEASFVRKGGMVQKDLQTGALFGHNGLPNLLRMFAPHCNKVLLVHFGSWFFKNIKESRKKIRELAKENGVEILVGYDGMEICL